MGPHQDLIIFAGHFATVIILESIEMVWSFWPIAGQSLSHLKTVWPIQGQSEDDKVPGMMPDVRQHKQDGDDDVTSLASRLLPGHGKCDFDNYLGDKLDQNWHLTSLKMSSRWCPAVRTRETLASHRTSWRSRDDWPLCCWSDWSHSPHVFLMVLSGHGPSWKFNKTKRLIDATAEIEICMI